MEELEPITIRMKPSLKQELHALAIARRVKLYQVAEEAIAQYLGKLEGQAVPEVPPKYRPYLKMLAEILSSGDENLIGLVVTPLEYARRQLRRGGESRTGE